VARSRIAAIRNRPADGELMVFWKALGDIERARAETVQYCTIITTEANSDMTVVYDRIQVITRKKLEGAGLGNAVRWR
jgi:putative SOS response-associated peptidase YedK